MSPEIAAATAVVAAVAGALVPARRLVRGGPGRWTSPVLVATLAALGGAGAALLAGSWVELVTFALLALGCAVLVAVDLDSHRLPDVLVLPTAVALVGGLAVAAATTDTWPDFGRALLGGLALGVGFLTMALISPRALGLGDVKLAALLGIFLGWFGWSAVLAGVVATFLLGGVAALLLLVLTRASRSTALAFGPWLVLGAAVGAVLVSTGATPTP
ncbi:prepilin peptidase [Pseudactinotalea suaedae]|uniref:prepilin peptidase n=1 Tax=Pseudactinotalea suaedae TaxID=1524924 RepID=UPI0012E1B12C|nr:prepilin peptidase [Pseudactinotalea suaedae]